MGILSSHLLRSFALLILALLCQGHSFAQERITLTGRTLSKQDGKPISGVILLLELIPEGNAKPHQLTYAQSQSDGTFTLEWKASEATGKLQLNVRRLGYATQLLPLHPPYKDLALHLTPQEIQLKQVQVRSAMLRSRGDTTSYNASRLATAATYTLEDLIKRIPTLEVDRNGKILFAGKPINAVYIEGMNMLGGRYAVATKNLKADDIASIDLIERFQEMKFLRGKQAGDDAILNVHLKPGSKLRPVGELQSFGGRLEERPHEAVYGGQALLFSARKSTQLMALGGANHSYQPIADQGLAYEMSGLGGQEKLGITALTGGVKTGAIGSRTDLGLGNFGTTINGIHRFGEEETTLRYNLGYTHSRLQTYDSKEIRQLNQGAVNSYTESNLKEGHRKLAQGVLNYTANTSKSYFQEHITLDINKQEALSELLRQTTPIEQQARELKYRLRSSTKWSHPTAKGGRLDLHGDLEADALPELQYISPTARYAFHSDLSGYTLRFSSSIGYSLRLIGRWGLAGSIAFLGHYGQAKVTTHSSSSPYQVDGGGLQVETSPSLSYIGTSTDFTLSFPLTLLSEGYRYGTTGDKQMTPLFRLYPGISTELRLQPLPELKCTLKANYRGVLHRNLSTFLLTPIRTSYDHMIDQQESQLLAQRLLGGQLTIYWHRPLDGFFSSLNLGWKRTLSPYSSIEDLQAEQHLQQSIRAPSQQDNYMLLFSVSKLLGDLNTTCSLSSSLNWMQRPIIRQGERLSTQGGGYDLRPRISIAPWEWLSLDFSGAYQVNLLRTPHYNSKSSQWSFSPSLSLHPWKLWFFSISHDAEWSKFPMSDIRPSHVLEASARYQGKRWTFKLSGENLLNELERFSISYSPLDEYIQRTRLRPRSLLFSISWRY